MDLALNNLDSKSQIEQILQDTMKKNKWFFKTVRNKWNIIIIFFL